MMTQKRKSNTCTIIRNAAVIVAVMISVLVACRSIAPLLNPKHAVATHSYKPSQQFFQNAQKLWIFTRHWLPAPDQAPKGIMFCSHGFGDHCGRYSEYVQFWVENGFIFSCMDHQGHGQSEGERAYVEDFEHYVDDFEQFLDFTIQLFPQYRTLPRFLVGGSMGGAIASLVANRRPHFFKGIQLLAPAIISNSKAVAPWQIELARFFSSHVPKMPVGSLGGSETSHDSEMTKWFKADPLTYKGVISARWGANMFDAMEKIRNEAAHKMVYPFIVAYGTDDTVTSIDGGQFLMDNSPSSDKVFKKYEGWRHALLYEPGKEVLYRELMEWVKQRL